VNFLQNKSEILRFLTLNFLLLIGNDRFGNKLLSLHFLYFTGRIIDSRYKTLGECIQTLSRIT